MNDVRNRALEGIETCTDPDKLDKIIAKGPIYVCDLSGLRERQYRCAKAFDGVAIS